MTGPAPIGALLDEDVDPVAGNEVGPLVGSTFVVKDLFAVRGCVVGAGQPTWAATHDPEPEHAPAVARLLEAGATLVGRAHTSEMAYSLSGRDNPYGMPVNPAALDRDTGGSSSGSAAAVAGGLADLGLGTDTLGSIRVPASSCGIFGWRPTHGLVPLDGVHPLAPSLDTVGLLARDADLLRRGAEALAGRAFPDQAAPHRVRLAADAFGVLDDTLREALLAVADLFGADGMVALVPDDQTLEDLTRVVRDVQGPEFAALHRAWIESAAPTFGEGVGERIAHALAVSEADHARAVAIRDRLQAHVATVLAPGDLVLLPAAGPPPRREATAAVVADARRIAASLSVVGSLAGLPTVTIPALVVDGAPVGLSVLAPCGEDDGLLSLAAACPPVPPATRPGSA